MLEVCVDSIESAAAAVAGGAQRLELCSSLNEDGLTPTVGLLKFVKKRFPRVPVFAMLRPTNQEDFIVTANELEVILEDMKMLDNNGADGFVFGALLHDKSIDTISCKKVIEAANHLPVTFHRAFDRTCLEKKNFNLGCIAGLGFTRLLTSGFGPSAESGLDEIADMKRTVDNERGKLIIMPGCGINENNAEKILSTTMCKEFHASAKVHEFGAYFVTDKEKVKRLVEIGKKFKEN